MVLVRTSLVLSVTGGLGILLALAGCGTGTPTTGTTGSSPGGGSATVSIRSVDGQSVLVDQAGAALYTNDQDGTTQSRCVSSDCTAIWAPLTVPNGSQPTAGSGVTGNIGSVQRSDGSHQVTLDGKPLYTFSFDHGAGRVTGNGERDSFGGTAFTWHSALAASGTPAPTSTPTSTGYSGGY